MTRVIAIVALLAACEPDGIVGSNFLGLPDAATAAQCTDGDDNDADGAPDFPFDPGCESPEDDSEIDPQPPPACSDGDDNDLDGITDFPLEPGCASAADVDETDPSPLPACSDGDDNDGDGAIDYPDDPGCQSAGGASELTETA